MKKQMSCKPPFFLNDLQLMEYAQAHLTILHIFYKNKFVNKWNHVDQKSLLKLLILLISLLIVIL